MRRTSRRTFIRSCGALAASAAMIAPAGRLASLAAEAPTVRLKSWELVHFDWDRKFKDYFKITAEDGSVGWCRQLGGIGDLRAAEAAVRGENLLGHEALYELMKEKGVPESQLKIIDIACWDLHARMLDKPLHALLGTKKDKILRYGDVRGTQPGYTPEKYAASVVRYFEQKPFEAVKLHFPGAMRTEDSISFEQAMDTLRAVRDAVGPEKILAWDPYYRSAESATPSVDEAKQMIQLMDELDYAWFEGPLPPVPYATQIPKYVELMEMKPKLRIQAEGPGSPIGDGTEYEDMLRWVESGAVNQCSTDAYIASGLTNALRMMEYARAHREHGLVINLHWAWAPHAHLAMAYEDEVCPIIEFPMTEDIPKEYMRGPHLMAPDWPGIYAMD